MTELKMTVEDARAAEGWERVVEASLPWDMGDRGGIHGTDLNFILKGKRGAVQFRVVAQAYLPHVQKRLWETGYGKPDKRLHGGRDWPMAHGGLWAMDLGFHSPVPMYEGHETIDDDCPHVGGKPCYYDGSTLNAESVASRVFSVVGKRPEELLWPELEDYYVHTFYGEENA